MRALLDTNILIATVSDEPTPDLNSYDDVAVSVLTWSELVRGLHLTTDLDAFKVRLARFNRLRDLFGPGLAYDEACVRRHDEVLRRVSAAGGSARGHLMDRMIAATALEDDRVLVTRDRRGFAHLDGVLEVHER